MLPQTCNSGTSFLASPPSLIRSSRLIAGYRRRCRKPCWDGWSPRRSVITALAHADEVRLGESPCFSVKGVPGVPGLAGVGHDEADVKAARATRPRSAAHGRSSSRHDHGLPGAASLGTTKTHRHWPGTRPLIPLPSSSAALKGLMARLPWSIRKSYRSNPCQEVFWPSMGVGASAAVAAFDVANHRRRGNSDEAEKHVPVHMGS